MSEAKRRPMGLGRGLNALFGDAVAEQTAQPGEAVRELPLTSISPRRDQPRRHFAEEPLAELAKSIRVHGVLQPVVVRSIGDAAYEIIAGERRWRASQLAGLERIPVVVRDFDERDLLAVAVVENVQREQLNPIEEGYAYSRLISEFGLNQEQVAQAVHKSRSHIANLVRLTELDGEVQAMVADGQLSMGHARALLGSVQQTALARRIVAEKLSVRQVEALRQGKGPGAARAARPVASAAANDDLALLERQLGDLLGLKVTISHEGAGGRVSLTYGSLEQLDLICQRLSGERI